MTKNEQTIANLKKLKSVHNGSYGADIDRAIEVLKQQPCGDAIGALEKQTPCPVKITASTKRCGACNRQLSSNRNTHLNYNYCPKCGQAIDWRVK